MSSFRTEIEIEKFPFELSYSDKSTFVGSCFTENMGKKFSSFKFQTLVNPFGIIYNPASVVNTLSRIMNKHEFKEEELFHFNENWISFEHHGDFSSPDKETCLKRINQGTAQAHEHLKNSKFLFITFGTAWVYYRKEGGKLAANCHKIPAREFDRKMLSVEEIVSDYIWLVKRLKEFNPGLQIIFTVSPVRHWKDGAHGNQLSKSTLLLAIDQIQKHFNDCFYFPSYELVLDDLRDYRFFDSDMLHPNQVAVDYIWKKLKTSFIAPEAVQLMKEVEKIVQAKSHRALNPTSESHQKFLKSFHKKTQDLQKKLPALDWTQELEYFSKL